MKNDFKIMIGALVATFLLIVGLSALFGGKGEVESTSNTVSEVQGVEADPEYYDLGNVQINGGVVTKEYEVKNTTDKNLRLKKIATSCMCTQAKVKIGDKETKYFGMEGHGDNNPPVNLEIASGEKAVVTVEFDPAAHGSQGVGPFDRIVYLTFSDPAGIKELKFSGTVVN